MCYHNSRFIPIGHLLSASQSLLVFLSAMGAVRLARGVCLGVVLSLLVACGGGSSSSSSNFKVFGLDFGPPYHLDTHVRHIRRFRTSGANCPQLWS